MGEALTSRGVRSGRASNIILAVRWRQRARVENVAVIQPVKAITKFLRRSCSSQGSLSRVAVL